VGKSKKEKKIMEILKITHTEASVIGEAISGYMAALDRQRENLLSSGQYSNTNKEQYELRMATAETLKQKLYDPQRPILEA
jgi:hypothetical protein